MARPPAVVRAAGHATYGTYPDIPQGGSAVAEPPWKARGDGPGRYLIAPAVRPACTCRWKMKYTMSTGSIAIIMPAIRPPQSPS